MDYYKVLYDYGKSDNWVNCEEVLIGGLSEYSVYEGRQIYKEDAIVLKYDSREGDIVSDYIANMLRWPVISERAYSLIMRIINEEYVQFLPATLVDSAGIKQDSMCYVVNVLDVMDGIIDMNKSEYNVFKAKNKEVIAFVKHVLDVKESEHHTLFRAGEDIVSLFVSEEIKRIVEDNGLSGFDFISVTE